MPDKTNKNQPVAKTVMTLTMIHPESFDPSKMSATDVAYHIDHGEFVGVQTSSQTTDIADEDVASELKLLGNDGTYFESERDPLIDLQ